MAAESEVERKMREIQERIGRLENSQRELERSLEDMDAERRRMGDRIHDAGDGDPEAEAERDRLSTNWSNQRRDYERNSRELDELRAEAADLQLRIDELRHR